MAMTLRLPPELEEEIRTVAEEDRRSVHQTVVHAVETYLAQRETEEVRSDPVTLRALAEAQEGIRRGDVVYGTQAIQELLGARNAS